MSQNKNDKRKIKIIVLTALIVVFGVILIVTAITLTQRWMNDSQAVQTNKETQESSAESLVPGTSAPPGATYATDAEITTGEQPVIDDQPVDNPVDFKEMREQNPDVYSWIYIRDTQISLPVLQSSVDDNFYLNHDWQKNDVFAGAIYSQSKNKRDYSDRVTVLYGHNMANGSMFANLFYFMDDDFFDSHRYFYIFTEDRKLTYEVVSAFEYDNRHILNSFDFKDDAVFQSWLDNAKNPHSLYSKVRDSVKLDLNSKMLVLSTCTDTGDNRFLVQGVLVKDEKAV